MAKKSEIEMLREAVRRFQADEPEPVSDRGSTKAARHHMTVPEADIPAAGSPWPEPKPKRRRLK